MERSSTTIKIKTVVICILFIFCFVKRKTIFSHLFQKIHLWNMELSHDVASMISSIKRWNKPASFVTLRECNLWLQIPCNDIHIILCGVCP